MPTAGMRAVHTKGPPRRSFGPSAPARNRTWNLRIKSPLLCQLSYKGGRALILASYFEAVGVAVGVALGATGGTSGSGG